MASHDEGGEDVEEPETVRVHSAQVSLLSTSLLHWIERLTGRVLLNQQLSSKSFSLASATLWDFAMTSNGDGLHQLLTKTKAFTKDTYSDGVGEIVGTGQAKPASTGTALFLAVCPDILLIDENLLPDLSGDLVEPHHTQGVSVNEQEAFKQSMIRLVLCLVCLSLYATRKGVAPPSNVDQHTLNSAGLLKHIPSELLRGGRAHPLIASPKSFVCGNLWVPDHYSRACLLCSQEFGWLWPSQRRHHCRRCGLLVCGICSQFKKLIALRLAPDVAAEESVPKSERVCLCCYYALE